MKKFTLKPKIIFDKNSITYLRVMDKKRFFIIADPFLLKNKMIDKVTEELSGRDYKIYSDIVPDPPIESVARGIIEIQKYNPDCLIAIGGGSAIDTAKAILFYSKNKDITFVAIPTTSGTGSEVTSFSVITDKDKGVKYPLVSDDMLPDIAILDNEFVKSVPPTIVADTGMDVLVHGIEAYVSVSATDFSDAFAEKSIKLAWDNLIKSYTCPQDLDAKDKMHKASLMAGLAFNSASLGLNHAIAHKMGAMLKIPHGRMNAILLPEIIEFNSGVKSYTYTENTECAKKYGKIAKMIGIEGTNTNILVKKLSMEMKKLIKKLNMPLNLRECKVELPYELMEKIAEESLQDSCINTNPRAIKKEDVINILKKLC